MSQREIGFRKLGTTRIHHHASPWHLHAGSTQLTSSKATCCSSSPSPAGRTGVPKYGLMLYGALVTQNGYARASYGAGLGEFQLPRLLTGRREAYIPPQGRSPYDEVVPGEGEEDPLQPTQQYDYRGRPINPETRRMNRDIVRSHNEVMQVIGVAEPENPFSAPEAESQRRHGDYEEDVGLALVRPAIRCVESSGVFGLDGLRQRILVCAFQRRS